MKNKIFAVIAIVIVIGIIMVCTLGFNVDSSYKAYQLLDLEIGKDFNLSDIENITKEVFGKNYIEVNRAGVFSDRVEIKVSEASEEQINTLNDKINEKYEIKNTIEDIDNNYIPNYKLRDVVKPYIIPLAIATVIILVYLVIRFRKIGIAKVVSQIVSLSIMAELFYGAIIAITRYPVNRLVMPVGVAIYIAILTVLTAGFEKQIKKEKTENEVKE